MNAFILYMVFQTRIGHPYLGIIIPSLIFGISFILTYLLIRYFNKDKS